MFTVQPGDMITLLFLSGLSLIIVMLVFSYRKKIDWLGVRIDEHIEQNKYLRLFLYLLMFVFVIVAYLTKPIYYTLYSTGVIGDSLSFAMYSLEKNIFIMEKHSFHPLFAQLLVKFALAVKFLNPCDVFFKEKAFILNSLPMRIFASCGLFLIFFLFRNILKFSFLKSTLAFFFLGTSFIYWLWGIQPNALAIVFFFQILTIWLTLKAVTNDSLKYYIFSAISTSFCFYAHISTGYFNLGTVIFVILYLFVIERKKKFKFKLIILGIYLAIVFVLAALFYFIITSHIAWYRNTNILQFLNKISDPRGGGEFKIPSLLQAIYLIKENLITGTVHFFGIWLKVSLFEKVLIVVMISAILSLFVSFILTARKIESRFSTPILYGAILTLVTMIGFIFRNAGMHYYSIAIIPNAFLLLVLLFAERRGEDNFAGFINVILCVLILGMFIYNGFSSKRVYLGRDVRSCEIYRIYDDINRIAGGKTAYYLEFMQPYRDHISELRNHVYITNFYANKFSHIHWDWEPIGVKALYSLMAKEKDAHFYVGDSYMNRLLENKDTRISIKNKISIDGHNYFELSLDPSFDKR